MSGTIIHKDVLGFFGAMSLYSNSCFCSPDCHRCSDSLAFRLWDEIQICKTVHGRKYVNHLLSPSSRPTTSFAWFVNPMKTFIYLIWRKFKKYIIALAVLVILTLFLALIVYTMPQQISALMVNGWRRMEEWKEVFLSQLCDPKPTQCSTDWGRM